MIANLAPLTLELVLVQLGAGRGRPGTCRSTWTARRPPRTPARQQHDHPPRPARRRPGGPGVPSMTDARDSRAGIRPEPRGLVRRSDRPSRTHRRRHAPDRPRVALRRARAAARLRSPAFADDSRHRLLLRLPAARHHARVSRRDGHGRRRRVRSAASSVTRAAGHAALPLRPPGLPAPVRLLRRRCAARTSSSTSPIRGRGAAGAPHTEAGRDCGGRSAGRAAPVRRLRYGAEALSPVPAARTSGDAAGRGLPHAASVDLGFLLYAPFAWSKRRSQRQPRVETELHQHVSEQVLRTGSSRAMDITLRAEAALGAFVRYPTGIRCLVVGERT